MAQRANVHQAVELLKIYQLRRENAVIFKQISSLKDEVVVLKAAQDTLQTQNLKIQEAVESVNATLLQQASWAQEPASDLRNLVQTQDQVQSCMHTWRTEYEEQTDKTSQWQENVTQILNKLGSRAEKQSEEGKHPHLHLCNQGCGPTQNDQTMNDEEAREIRTRDIELAEGFVSSQHKKTPSQTSRVVDSYETQVCISLLSSDNIGDKPNLRVRKSTMLNEPRMHVCNDTNRVGYSRKSGSSLVPNDIDLDEAANQISYASHHLGFGSPGSSLYTLPQDAFQVDSELLHDVETNLGKCEAAAFNPTGLIFNDCEEKMPDSNDIGKANPMLADNPRRKAKTKKRNGPTIATVRANPRRSQRIAEKTGKLSTQTASQEPQAHDCHIMTTNDSHNNNDITQMVCRVSSNIKSKVMIPATPRNRAGTATRGSKPNNHPVQPTSAQVCARGNKARPMREYEMRDSRLVQSPYNPKPRLVESIHRNQQRSRESSIVNEPALPAFKEDVRVATKVLGVLKSAGKSVQDQRSRKRRKQTLPSPPSIPILSTSSNAGERFKAWGR